MKAADTLKLYRKSSPATRLFLRGRFLLSQMELLESYVPDSGAILDLGCGHGLFANIMALSQPERNVTGIDLSKEKIDVAQMTVSARKNIRFLQGNILETDLPPCDVITIVDVLYLLPADEQLKVIRKCAGRLHPGGVLIWKAQERRPRWKYAWTYFQELLATSVGLTNGKHGRLCFLSREEALSMLKQAGFKAHIVEMKRRLPYTDILYVAVR